ncbi:MAG: DUF2986 domain-containing protein [Cycloclasticus sp.]
MNRQKKIQNLFSKRLKKAKAKLNPSSKPKYVSKAERAALALEQQNEPNQLSAATENQTQEEPDQ